MEESLPLPPPCHHFTDQDFDQTPPLKTILNHSDSSSSNSSISSTSSLASLPSFTQSSRKPAAAAVHHHCSATLKGHSSYIFSLSLHGNHLHSGSSGGEVRFWNTNSNPSAGNNFTVAEGYSAVKSIVVCGKSLFTAHQDHKIRVWEIDNAVPRQKYRMIAELPTANDRCMRLFLEKNYVKVRKNKKCTWVHHVDTVSALALSKDGAFLYSFSWDRTMKVWRTSDFKCVESVQNAHDDAINAAVLSRDGIVYTGSADRTIRIWKKNDSDKKHSLEYTLEKHKSAVNALALSSNGYVLYSGGACDRSIIVWESCGPGRRMEAAGRLRGHDKAILCLAVVNDLLFSGSADKTVRVWRRDLDKSYSCLAVLEGHRSPVKCLTADLDGEFGKKNEGQSGNSYVVYSGSLDFDIKVWEILVTF